MSAEPLPLASAAERLRGKPGRPPISDEERAKRKRRRDAARAAQLAAVCPRLFSVDAAARYTGLSAWTIRDLVHSGTLPRVVIPSAGGKDLRALRIDRADLDRLITAWKDAR